MRTFETGATRDKVEGKLEFGGFFSPAVLLRRAEYMHKHREQTNGRMRASDNWKGGMPRRQYIESALRHVVDVWLRFFGEGKLYDNGLEDAICAAMFNLEGLLFEILKGRDVKDVEPKPVSQAWLGQGPAPKTATEAQGVDLGRMRELAKRIEEDWHKVPESMPRIPPYRPVPMPAYPSRPGLHPSTRSAS